MCGLRVIGSLILLAVVSGQGWAAVDDVVVGSRKRIEWWRAQHAVIEAAFSRDIGRWATQLDRDLDTATIEQLVSAFAVCRRAGHDETLRRVIDKLAPRARSLPTSCLSSMADELVANRKWELAIHFVQQLPRAAPGQGRELVQQWAQVGDPKRLNAFLSEQGRTNDYWFHHQIRFHRERGKIDELVGELAAEVRRHPSWLKPVQRYVAAVQHGGIQQHDFRWLVKTCRPPTAFAALKLGLELRPAPKVAIKFLERSLDTAYRDADQAAMDRQMSQRAAVVSPRPKSWKRQMRDWTKYELMTLYKQAGEAKQAQRLLEELTATNPDGLDGLAMTQMAGQIQAASGARVVQGRILAAEQKRKDDSSYWRGRGQYFAGRQEHKQALAAFAKALAIAKTTDEKVWAADYYAHHLENAQGRPAAVKMLLAEYRKCADQDPIYADNLVRSMAAEFPRDYPELFWKYLAARKSWYWPERMLWTMAEREVRAGRADAFWDRAERLARVPDAPHRALVLGWIMTRSQASRRAIPLLSLAVENLTDKNQRQSAGFTLFEAHLHVGQWQQAERLWLTAKQKLTPGETPQWLAEIAVCAAKQGAKRDAMRLWRRHANIDREATGNVAAMVEAGLRAELLAFYRQLKQDDPHSGAPDRLIAHIQSSD